VAVAETSDIRFVSIISILAGPAIVRPM